LTRSVSQRLTGGGEIQKKKGQNKYVNKEKNNNITMVFTRQSKSLKVTWRKNLHPARGGKYP